MNRRTFLATVPVVAVVASVAKPEVFVETLYIRVSQWHPVSQEFIDAHNRAIRECYESLDAGSAIQLLNERGAW